MLTRRKFLQTSTTLDVSLSQSLASFSDIAYKLLTY